MLPVLDVAEVLPEVAFAVAPDVKFELLSRVRIEDSGEVLEVEVTDMVIQAIAARWTDVGIVTGDDEGRSSGTSLVGVTGVLPTRANAVCSAGWCCCWGFRC